MYKSGQKVKIKNCVKKLDIYRGVIITSIMQNLHGNTVTIYKRYVHSKGFNLYKIEEDGYRHYWPEALFEDYDPINILNL